MGRFNFKYANYRTTGSDSLRSQELELAWSMIHQCVLLPASAKEASAVTLFLERWLDKAFPFSLWRHKVERPTWTNKSKAFQTADETKNNWRPAPSTRSFLFGNAGARAPSPSKSGERLPDMELWSQINVLAFSNLQNHILIYGTKDKDRIHTVNDLAVSYLALIELGLV